MTSELTDRLPLPTVADRADEALRRLIVNALAETEGSFGVAVKHLRTGQLALVNPEREYMSASLFKLSVMYEAFQQEAAGTLLFTETLTVTEEDARYDTGTLRVPIGGTVTVTDALTDMITISDNTMGLVMLGRVKSWYMNETMSAVGLKHTRVTLDDQVTSPADMLRMLEMIASGKAVSLSASRGMLSLLLDQRINDRLPRYLPEGTAVAHKTGEWDGIRHDVGIVFAPQGPYVIVVLSDGLADLDEGCDAIARLSERVYDYFAASAR